jgi:DNA modification methylase
VTPETFHAGPNLGQLSDVTIIHGDCIEAMRELADASVDAIVTDPPYGLEFMGKEWDSPWKQGADVHAQARTLRADEMGEENKRRYIAAGVNKFAAGLPFQQWCEQWATEALRVLKPGGHLLAFGGMRTQHRLGCAIEDAGFEIRDSLAWIFGSGFPKSHNVSVALDRIVPLDARCVCAQRSSQTVGDSRDGYPSSRGSDGGQLLNGSGVDPASVPSPTDAPVRSRDGLRSDAPVPAPASTYPDAANGHLSSAGSQDQAAHPSTVDQPSASVQSDTQTSTLDAPASALRRTADHTRHTDGSAFDSARYQHMACATCGGIDIPQGLGTALKPAIEIIVVGRKPFKGNVAANVLAHGTGALNIDACRIDGEANRPTGLKRDGSRSQKVSEGWDRPWKRDDRADRIVGDGERLTSAGRWPANVVLDESQAAVLDEQSGTLTSGALRPYSEKHENASSFRMEREKTYTSEKDSGGASRFFLNVPLDDLDARFKYCAKAPKKERPTYVDADGKQQSHATVKPLALMRWLVRLVTPPGGTVLDPFAGSGTTVEAALLEGFVVVGIEREADYLPMIQQRIARCLTSS